jgi:hypothetical protein
MRARTAIVMREVGHRVLQYAGDSSSRVAPVEQLPDNTYRISFESGFSFQPDSLVRVISGVVARSGLPAEYIVNVREPASKAVVFGYAISGYDRQSIVPCSGRNQPVKQYCIDIIFRSEVAASNGYNILWILIPALLLVGALWFWNRNRNPAAGYMADGAGSNPANELHEKVLHIGSFQFRPGQLTLTLNGQVQTLTDKECRLLLMLGGQLNEVVERSRLQKEIWEDEGVIVGRSLDMFISRLRRKLEADASVRIISIPKRGYKMEIIGSSDDG